MRSGRSTARLLAGLMVPVAAISIGGCVSDLLRPDVEEDTSTVPPPDSVRAMWKYRGQAEAIMQVGKVSVENQVEQPQCFLSGDIVGIPSFGRLQAAVGRLRDQLVRQRWKVEWQSSARPDPSGGGGGPGVMMKNPVDGYIVHVLGGQEQGAFELGVYVHAPCRK